MMEASSEILFTLTKAHLDTGMRGIPIGYCPTSQVHPQEGLTYRGHSITELAGRAPEEVIYLLLNGAFPTAGERDAFQATLSAHANNDPEILSILEKYPKHTHPMKFFMAALNLVGIYNKESDLKKSGYQLIAKLPQLLAWTYHVLNDWGPVAAPRAGQGYVENFVHMLAPPGVDIAKLTEYLRCFLILHLDHGGGNLSTFVGKGVASAHSDLFESLLAAMAGLAGPLHGKANQEALKFLEAASAVITDPSDEAQVAKFVAARIAKREKIFGFGHAVLRVEDLRATVQYDLGDRLCPDDRLFILAQTFRRVAPRILGKIEKISNPYPNVDAVSGCLLSALGLRDENYYTVLFGWARCIGIMAQIFYERLTARDGRGTPIMRPKYLYNGPQRAH